MGVAWMQNPGTSKALRRILRGNPEEARARVVNAAEARRFTGTVFQTVETRLVDGRVYAVYSGVEIRVPEKEGTS